MDSKKIKRIIAWIFVSAAILMDIIVAFIGFAPYFDFGFSYLIIIYFCMALEILIKVTAILLGCFLRDGCGDSPDSACRARLRVILVIIITDILSTKLAGCLACCIGTKFCHDYGCDYYNGITSMLGVEGVLLTSFGFYQCLH